MIKDLINSAKLTAMDIKSEIKDAIHDATTTLPEAVQQDYSKTDSQTMQSVNLDYMSSNWGVMSSQMTANKIDMIADKINFVSEMIQQGLLAFDPIEEELQAYARGTVPPQPAQLVSLASRIDSNQKQIFMGLQKLKELSIEVDRATDKLQGGSSKYNGGWGNSDIRCGW